MMFFSALSVGLALLPFAAAQTTHMVNVSDAAGELNFYPEAIFAQPGDQVVFSFFPKNHTVTQSSFANPCGPLEGGLNSGFHPVAANSTDAPPTFSYTVKDTNPTWFYCAQGARTATSHCGKGMVFAVNCGADGAPNSFTNFKNSALAIGAELQAEASSASTVTAASATVTIPAVETGSPATAVVTLESSTWTTSYMSYPGSPAPTPASLTGNVIKVVVGGPGIYAFNPPIIQAQPRDIVQFEFHEKNHTVTRSSFANPCLPLSASSSSLPMFDSGFMPNSGSGPFPTFNLTINDTAPIWGYCAQVGHCGKGMVFAINSNEASMNNFATFQQIAMGLNGSAGSLASSNGTASGNSAMGKGLRSGSTFVAVATVVLGMIMGSVL